ncbi:flagellar motor protein MotB [Xylophilus sp. GW821-FHT01B05]
MLRPLPDVQETGVSSKLDARQHDTTVVKRGGGRHEEEAHGGAWKVAFADFCLALMCLFLVLWLMAARQSESLQEVLRSYGGSRIDQGQGRMAETVSGPRGSLIERQPQPGSSNAPSPLRAQGQDEPAVEGMDPASRPIKTRLESRADLQELARLLESMGDQAGLSGHVQTVVTPYGLRVMLHDTDRQGMFQLGSSIPSERFRQLLRQMGPLFAQIENQMLVVGHTDARQYAGGELAGFSNWTLSLNRAMAARTQLTEGGMPARSVLQVVGMADRAPLDEGDNMASANRRIELLILTPAQSRLVAAMFGTPDGMQLLAPGVRVGLPGREELDQLRLQLQAQDRSSPNAN